MFTNGLQVHFGFLSGLSMNQSSDLVPLHYVGQIQHYLESLGLDVSTWLASVDLTSVDVIEDKKLLSFNQYRHLIKQAILISQQPQLGLYVGQRLSINSHGALGFALLSCESIRQVLSVFQRYVMTRTPLIDVTINEESDTLCITMLERIDLAEIRPCFFEVMMVTVTNILNMVLPNQALVTKINMPFEEPDYKAIYQSLFDCDLSFSGEKAQIWLNTAMLDLPLIHADPHAFHHAKLLCEAELQTIKSQQSLKGQVHAMLLNSREQFLDLKQISHALHMSPRTLHRHLKKQNSSYHQILDEVRAMLVKQYIILYRQNIQQVAFNLGYSDVANFRRAFKRWYGCSPQAMRQRENIE